MMISPDGKTMREKWYALVRRYCGIIANRQRTLEPCKECFAMRLCKSDMKNYPRHGCIGCVEMDSFFDEAAKLFCGEEADQEWLILGSSQRD